MAGRELVALHEDRGFHLAPFVPNRRELARSLRRIASARWPLTGASDHLVSEAVYLCDPDGNGIEIYRDRPRSQWPTDADGSIRMATIALGRNDVLAELDDGAGDGAPVAAGTRIGHVHLQVGRLDTRRAALLRLARVRAAGSVVETIDGDTDAALVRDPFGIAIVLRGG